MTMCKGCLEEVDRVNGNEFCDVCDEDLSREQMYHYFKWLGPERKPKKVGDKFSTDFKEGGEVK